LTAATESGLFDIIAHADLCKKFRFYPEKDCAPLFKRWLQAMKKNDLAMELNTAGLRKDCKEIYPSPQIVGLAANLGVPITFASDAHTPTEVGMNFSEAVQLARKFGYTQSCRFTQRKRALTPL
jgi:histidinol-phosphatase (PHP family)